MLPGQLDAVDSHYRQMQSIQAVAVRAGRVAWRSVDPDGLSVSWQLHVAQLAPVVSAVQERAATSGAGYVGRALAEQGITAAPVGQVRSDAFAGTASDGRSLAGLLYSPITTVKSLISRGAPVDRALRAGRDHLDTILRTQVADAGRVAAGVDIAVRPTVGYVRMLNPPSCSRCLILAGRWYRYSAGFQRHPRCDCVHVPSRENVAGDLRTDPTAYFDGLPREEQDRLLGKSNAQAIRDGADLNQVENRRMRGAGASAVAPGARLTPEDIYTRAGSRAEAIRLLELNGYIFTR